jgi:hypothetical protein
MGAGSPVISGLARRLPLYYLMNKFVDEYEGMKIEGNKDFLENLP